MESLPYEFNPYTFARISAMKSQLLQKEDYDKLLKMDASEITKYLQEGTYREEISRISIRYSGIKLIENVINLHLSKIFIKLKRISDPSTEKLMNLYLRRYDFWNIKTVLRAKISEYKEDELNDILLPVGTLDLGEFKQIFAKATVAAMLEESGLVEMKEMKEILSRFEESKDLSDIENMLDQKYLTDTLATADRISEEGRLFKDFFRFEVDIFNMKLILKKIFFQLDKSYVSGYIVKGGNELTDRQLKSLLDKPDFKSFLKELTKTSYAKIFDNIKDDNDDLLLKCEVQLEEFLLKKCFLLFHQHPLSVDIVLGYMFAAEIEARNIRAIIKSRMLEFTQDYVKKLIIIKKSR